MAERKEAGYVVKDGVKYWLRDEKARELIEECFSPSNPPPAPSGVLPPGGTTDQVLKKASDDDFDVEWGDGGGSVYYDTKENWNSMPSFIGERGAIYIYSNRNVYYDGVGNPIVVPGMKVGDGSAYLIDLPFTDENVLRTLANHVSDNTRHITQAERIFWNNKVSAYMDSVDDEKLVLSKTNYVVED